MGKASEFPMSWSIMLAPSQQTSCHQQARQARWLGNICGLGGGSGGSIHPILGEGPVDDEEIIHVGNTAREIKITVGVAGVCIAIEKSGIDQVIVLVIDFAVKIGIAIKRAFES